MKLVENVREYLIKRSNDLASNFASDVSSAISQGLSNQEEFDPIESPIEQLFLIEWKYQEQLSGSHFPFNLTSQYQDEDETGKYILDFFIDFMNDHIDATYELGAKAPRTQLLGVELDGHWHEKTKHQVQYDKERDRFFIKKSWIVLHFSGSEIVRDTERCVSEVLSYAWKLRREYLDKKSEIKNP